MVLQQCPTGRQSIIFLATSTEKARCPKRNHLTPPVKTIALPSVVRIGACFFVLLGSCREKGEQTSSNDQIPRKHDTRVKSPIKTSISEYQKKRIRSAVDSARKTSKTEERIQNFQELLQSNQADEDFLHELAIETSSASSDCQEAFVEALVRMYRSGEYNNPAVVVNALKTEGTLGGILVHLYAQDLRRQKDLVVGAYEKLLVAPPKNVHPSFYADIASGAARELGYPQALARIPNIHDSSVGASAAKEIITNWTFSDPQAVSIYLRDLPDSEFRNSLIIHMAEKVAAEEDIDMAYGWASYLKGESKDKAIKIVKREEGIIKRRAEQQAQRDAKNKPR
jgi:hypothetical protein